MKFSMIILFFCFITFSFDLVQSENLQISQFGGKQNTNIAKALISAWTQACASTSAVKIVIPKGTYQMTHVKLKGPCKAPIELYVDGTIKAPVKPQDVGGDEILRIDYVNALTISGNGVFDGQGAYAWKQNDCSKSFNCKLLGMNFAFNYINNSIVRGITSKDSKHFHVNVLGCNNFTFDGFKVSAPHDSANTDGIHIGRSRGVNVLNTNIATGDDCVSLGDGSKQVLVQNVKCGPGHGISVGSLGKYKEEEPVDGITIKGCTLKGTDNGVRIKTWPSEPGTITVTNMKFEDITMDNVKNPIIIDQEYCPWNQCTKKYPSKIKISKVTIKNIKGTSATKEGVIIACSSGVPCEGVEISNVDLKFKGAPAIAVCSNVKPKITGKAPTCTAPSNKKE
ncbi:polygalacturonase-like [Vigna unguiculata]|uniref:polygalacturonase-like n=1 Tax=Vigna unguiculata TaxID=3917 RepID=UPI001015CE9C|nr:polygalacturonase-like [Vigna unguiculata]